VIRSGSNGRAEGATGETDGCALVGGLALSDGEGTGEAPGVGGGTDVPWPCPQAATARARTATMNRVRRGTGGIPGCYRRWRGSTGVAESRLLGCAAKREVRLLDRLISGAGAVTDRADRLVRLFTSGRGPDVLANRPGSVIVIILLIGTATFFGLLAVEATDNPTPRTLAPADVAAADDLGNRIFATIEGVLEENYVETYPDDDNDGVQDTDESGDAWYYFLVDDSGRGVTVRSTRHPDDLYQYTATGVVVRDPAYVGVDVAQFHELDGTSEFDLDSTFYLDAIANPGGEPRPLDLGEEMPADGTFVSITGPYFGYLDVCSGDADGDGECEEPEFDLLDAFIGDPDSGRAITVVKEDHPAQVPITFTGMLRSDPRSIVDAKATQGLQFEQLGITVSDRYLLVDRASPANGTLSLAVAVAAGLLAAVLAIGLAGGYLVFRKSKAALPSGGRRLAAGEAIPLRVTGSLRREDGLLHVREASAQLVRFPLWVANEVAPPEAEDAPPVPSWSTVAAEVQPPPVPAAPSLPADVPTTLIVERRGKPEGVALGKGELKQVTAGRVMRFRGPRAALRVVAGTGALLLSFETAEDRDRAAGELIGESGLLIQGSVAGGAG
jgi:hypothetical protein